MLIDWLSIGLNKLEEERFSLGPLRVPGTVVATQNKKFVKSWIRLISPSHRTEHQA